jgi:hypothetical protein
MQNKIEIIIFTYKRAILLDACLNSIFKHCTNIKYPINIIYRYDPDHHKSYLKLKKLYGNKIILKQRKKISIFNHFSLLLRPLNLVWIYKWISIIQQFTNFKEIFEKILIKSKCKFVMLCTDDTLFIKNNRLNNNIFNLIKRNGKFTWFRSNFGLDLNPNRKFQFINNFKNIIWNSDDKNINFFMKYNFQVEGSIYLTSSLLEFVKPFIYNNPTTLEAIGYKEASFRNYFKQMISPLSRTAITYELNTVQTDTHLRFLERPQYSPGLLMKLFLKGYKLRFNFNAKYVKFINEFGNKRVIPIKLFLKFKTRIIEISKIIF